MLKKQEQSLHFSLKQTEQQELNSVSNMPAEIDIDALKIFTKSRTNETENRKKLKTASLNSRFTGSKKEECTSTCSLLKNFETVRPKVTVNI